MLFIDEIDRVEVETEALLLEVLSDFQVSIPELGTVDATQMPLVFLTSNGTRELSEALKRRCLYLYLDYPTTERERAIVAERVPGISAELADEVVRVVSLLRSLELQKHPSISETLDWARHARAARDRARRRGHDDGDAEPALEIQGGHRHRDQGALRHLGSALVVLDVLSGFLGELRAAGCRSRSGSRSTPRRRPTLFGLSDRETLKSARSGDGRKVARPPGRLRLDVRGLLLASGRPATSEVSSPTGTTTTSATPTSASGQSGGDEARAATSTRSPPPSSPTSPSRRYRVATWRISPRWPSSPSRSTAASTPPGPSASRTTCIGRCTAWRPKRCSRRLLEAVREHDRVRTCSRRPRIASGGSGKT